MRQNEIEAVSKDGTTYTIIETIPSRSTSDLGGKSSIDGLPSYRLADGRALNRNNEDPRKFTIVETGEELTAT